MSAEAEVERELSSDEAELLHIVVTAREQIELLQEAERKAKEQLAFSMRGFTHGMHDGTHVVTISRSRTERFDSTAYRRDHPIEAAKYMRLADNETVRVLPTQAAKRLLITGG